MRFFTFYSEFRDKFDDDNVVFTQKYVVGKQQVCIHFVKEEKKMMLSNALIFLTNCKKNLPVSDWTPFYFNSFNTKNNIPVYQFISENENEIHMFEHFCFSAIS